MRTRHPKKRWFGSKLKSVLMGIITIIGICIGSFWLSLQGAAQQPIDAYLVLGGSIRRELHVAQLSKSRPDIPVLISAGSQDPCLRLIYEQFQAPFDQVWLEKCAHSTFENFTFSVPTLRRWKVRHIKLITSGSHTRRAGWMAKIILGAHRIWVDLEVVSEDGIPGNQENALKTTADLARSILWAGVSQVYSPRCDNIIPLTDVNLDEWRQKGFKCEHQAGIEGS